MTKLEHRIEQGLFSFRKLGKNIDSFGDIKFFTKLNLKDGFW